MISEEFWNGWRTRMATDGLPHQWRMCEEPGRIENFRRAASGLAGGFQGRYYDDSDVYKLLEATEYALGRGYDQHQARRDEIWGLIASAQEQDGYISTYFQLEHPDRKFRALGAMHELYCGGHMIEAACASAERGDQGPIEFARKFADLIIDKGLDRPGHQELELALVRLARITEEQKYIDFAKRMVLARGTRPSPFEEELAQDDIADLRRNQSLIVDSEGNYDGRYLQDDKLLVEQDEPVGHSVRACYFYAAAADAFWDEPEHPVWNALQAIWLRLAERRMYLTGGIGAEPRYEGFGPDWQLPNRTGYCETCAAIALVFWARRMHRALGDDEYRQVANVALVNAVLSGVSHDCTLYYYENPLESWGEHERVPWYPCACCPPNVARLLLGHDLPAMEVTGEPGWTASDPRVLENANRVALTWGPLVYCAEAKDNGFAPQLVRVDLNAPIEVLDEHTEEGLPMLQVEGVKGTKEQQGWTYFTPYSEDKMDVKLKLRPYHSWCRSGANAMQVWLQVL